ncbi:MAG: hypothetical protein KA538_08245 [Azonexus sp.]|jgi:hypothetical protein|nr:hypothetical protein [Azonexus sp.]
MAILQWRNDADGFAFINSWEFDSTERAALTALVQPLVPGVVATVAGVVPDPLILTAVAVAASGYAAVGKLDTYGLCGGMAYAALDHWHARVPLPRGAHRNDQPQRTAPAPAAIRASLWERLLDSLTHGDVLRRTIEWSIFLNQVPTWFGGGAEGLKARTIPEWDTVRRHIDAGRPWPIGLIYTNRSVWSQHQVLVYGYENTGVSQGKLYVYDSNAPSQFADESHSEITLDFRGTTLVATSPSDTAGVDSLAGFFCSNYSPATPLGRAKEYGEFLAWVRDRRTFMVTDGARMQVAGAGEFSALGGVTANVRSTAVTLLAHHTRPRDGACFRERSSAPVYLFAGGMPFWIPDQVWMQRFGGFGQVRIVPDGAIAAFQKVPDEGTLLREWSSPKVWRMMNGFRRWVTTPAELAKWGGMPSVRVVPDDGLKPIPVGQPLPTPSANECAALRATIARLNSDIPRLEASLENLEGRALAGAKVRLQNARVARSTALARAAALQCP